MKNFCFCHSYLILLLENRKPLTFERPRGIVKEKMNEDDDLSLFIKLFIVPAIILVIVAYLIGRQTNFFTVLLITGGIGLFLFFPACLFSWLAEKAEKSNSKFLKKQSDIFDTISGISFIVAIILSIAAGIAIFFFTQPGSYGA